MRKSFDYGTMPDREEFEAAFAEECPNGTFRFGNDKKVGDLALSCDDLWEELQSVHSEWAETGNDEAGDWCSNVLYSLGFEWV